MADSLFRSSSALEAALEAPQICISISAKRCSTSHCCWESFKLRVAFSVSNVTRRSRRRRISWRRAASCVASSKAETPIIMWLELPADPDNLRTGGDTICIFSTKKILIEKINKFPRIYIFPYPWKDEDDGAAGRRHGPRRGVKLRGGTTRGPARVGMTTAWRHPRPGQPSN